MPHKIAILGASGYTGAELVRIIATHPSMEIVALSADRKAGQTMAEVYPHLRHLDLPRLVTIDEIDFAGVDLAFCALPHATTQEVVAKLPRDLKIVDLSADFRLRDPEAYQKWYGKPHAALDLQKEAVYGLTEFYRHEIAAARLVAGTGCNAATGQFALIPLIRAGVIDLDEIVIDLKAAASGAGRSLKEHLLFAELFENVKGYSLGGTHRHLGEFDQEFSRAAGRTVNVQFTPHLIPATRGILATLRAGRCRSDTQDACRRLYPRDVHSRPAVRRGAADEGCPGVELLPPRRGRGPHPGPRHRGGDARQPDEGLIGAGRAEREPDAGRGRGGGPDARAALPMKDRAVRGRWQD
jgi:N-acetyl-gamma-glutamyl-phosphate reductase